MKRVVLGLIIISIIFILGAVATMSLYPHIFNNNSQKAEIFNETATLNKENVSEEVSSLGFCELVIEPEKYDGKIVRLSAKFRIGMEGSWFFDSKCGVDNAAIVSFKNKGVWEIIDHASKQKEKTLIEDEKHLKNELYLTVIGKFRKVVYNYGGLIAPFQFEILKVEKVSP